MLNIEKDIDKLDNKVKRLEQETWATDILHDYKETNKRIYDINKRLIRIIVFLIVCLVASIGYTIYLLNDISDIDSDVIEIQDVETIDNSHIKIGDDIWEKSELQK